MGLEGLSSARENLPNVYTNITAREIDFVTRFGKNWDALRQMLGIMRPIRKAPGTKLVSYSASVTLASGSVDPGNVIPYSKATVKKVAEDDLTIEKYAILRFKETTGIKNFSNNFPIHIKFYKCRITLYFFTVITIV